LISSARIGDVATITFENQPLNLMSVGAGLVDALGDALSKTLSDPLVRAIVVGAAGRCFSAGADLEDIGNRDDTLDRLRWLTTDIVESASKPIVMAIHGLALGGGLEFAMAGHYRICNANSEFALPEVKLGLLPGAGGTQRLPRLVGADFALEMMLSGKQITADVAKAKGLVDLVARHDLLEEAVAFASACVERGVRPTRDLDLPGQPLGSDTVNTDRDPFTQAQSSIIRCIDAAHTMPFAEAMALEKVLFEELRVSDVSLGLRHSFFGRREVGHIPGIPNRKPVHPVQKVAIIGAGLMGTGIATALINAGLRVELIDPNMEIVEKAVGKIQSTLQRDAKKGRISPEAGLARLALLNPANDPKNMADADIIIEAVFEDLDVKRRVFADMERYAKPSAILATNTSTLDLDKIASFASHPDRVVGLHFFSPANIMKLVEIVRGRETSDETLISAMSFTKAIGKVGVVSGVCDGFIGNRMFEEYLRQAYFLLEEGALPRQVDAALESFGMAMGPFRTMDLAGQDIGWSIRKRRAIEQPDRPYSKIPDLVCELGRFGQKTGAGFYLYPDGRNPRHDPAIDELVVGHSNNIGVARRKIEDAEIIERCVFALVNEGAKLLSEGIAHRSIDIDVVYVNGYGFPEERGGPMFYADRYGVGQVQRKIAEFQNRPNGWAWAPASLLVELAKDGRGFGTVNTGNE
jgi:3-hydroxyacyl-CoA dehydrogenase